MRRITRHSAKFWFTACLILIGRMAVAQVEEDFELRGALSYNSDLTDNIDLSLSQEFRLEDNARTLEKSYTTLGVDYKLRRWIRFGLNYRFILNRHTDGTYGQRHRAMADLVLRAYSHRLTYSYRVRYQTEIKTYNYTQEYGFALASALRNTLKLSYTVNRMYEPYASFDLRILLRDPDEPGFTGIDRTRLVAGVDINLTRNRALEIYFMTYSHYNVGVPDRVYAIGFEFSFGSRGLLLGS